MYTKIHNLEWALWKYQRKMNELDLGNMYKNAYREIDIKMLFLI